MADTQKHRSFRTLLLAVSIEPHEIGGRLRRAREQRGWTQMTFAHEAHVSLSSVQRWERGDLPPVRELIRLAGILGIDPEELVEIEPTADARLLALTGRVEEVLGLAQQILAEIAALREVEAALSQRPRARRSVAQAARRKTS